MHNHIPISNTGQNKITASTDQKYMISTLQKVSRSCNKEKLKAVREYYEETTRKKQFQCAILKRILEQKNGITGKK